MVNLKFTKRQKLHTDILNCFNLVIFASQVYIAWKSLSVIVYDAYIVLYTSFLYINMYVTILCPHLPTAGKIKHKYKICTNSLLHPLKTCSLFFLNLFPKKLNFAVVSDPSPLLSSKIFPGLKWHVPYDENWVYKLKIFTCMWYIFLKFYQHIENPYQTHVCGYI